MEAGDRASAVGAGGVGVRCRSVHCAASCRLELLEAFQWPSGT